MTPRPYKPSNGCEGMDFMDEFCHRCTKDAKYRATQDVADGCPIVATALLFEPADPRYPKEWVTDEDGPRCTAFERVPE